MIDDLVQLLARHPRFVRSNTPLEILAGHMVNSLALFESTLIARADHPFYAPGRLDETDSLAADASAMAVCGDGGGFYSVRAAAACSDFEV